MNISLAPKRWPDEPPYLVADPRHHSHRDEKDFLCETRALDLSAGARPRRPVLCALDGQNLRARRAPPDGAEKRPPAHRARFPLDCGGYVAPRSDRPSRRPAGLPLAA